MLCFMKCYMLYSQKVQAIYLHVNDNKNLITCIFVMLKLKIFKRKCRKSLIMHIKAQRSFFRTKI